MVVLVHQQALSCIMNNFINKLSTEVRFGECKVDADGVQQHQNKRRFQRKPDKQHHLYSVWSITLCNSSKNVSPNDGSIVFVASPLHYLTFSKHTCISRSAEYVYANMKVNIADGILLRALCAIQIRK
ncbi:hypothetical protein Tsp_13164 [Trichinella spiralis]|uniref:hypothetical protein n=1 Tax=Trichinella spiralis TaxID=6334 RepID=UPI0001EFE079|nr:hypothetical protein Tsp_13164 [Trichinella spiralis]